MKSCQIIGFLFLSAPMLWAGLNTNSSTATMKVYESGAGKLTVYTDVPGHTNSVINGYASRARSDIYEIRVRSAATFNGASNEWVQCFANMTYNRGDEMPANTNFQTGTSSHGYQNFTAGWTHTYANIEMSTNSPVEVEVRKIGSTLLNSSNVIFKSAVHPAHKVSSQSNHLGRVYFSITNPCQVVIDINGQMDDHNAAFPAGTPGGRMLSGSPVHSLALYANPIMAKPVASSSNIIFTVTTNQSSLTVRLTAPDPSTYDTLVFAPGVHFTGPNFKVHPGKTYFIPGDAIVYGNIGNIGVPSAGYRCNGDRINILGYGSICSIQIPRRGYTNNSEYPEWNAWDGEKGQNEGIEIENAWDIKITGVSVIDPAGFNTRFDPQSGRTNDKCLVSWVKLHSWRVNGDGFGGYSAVEDSFIRACDDSTYVRSLRKRCTWWKDSNANIFRFINFKSGGIEDCDVIYARWRSEDGVGTVFEFADGLGVQPEVTELNLKMRNIRFHDKYPNPSRLISLALTESYTGLVFENISFYVPKNGRKSLLLGSELAPWYERLVFKNITYKTSGQGQYDPGTLLTATNFGDYFETNEYVANVLFDYPRDLTLTLSVNGTNGTATKNPNQATYVETTSVTLTALPKPLYAFTSWSGVDGAAATNNPLTIRMLDNRTITANFGPASIADPVVITNPGTNTWTVPAGVYSATIQAWGGGGAGGSAKSTGGTYSSGGGAGGSYAEVTLAVTPGQTYQLIVGAGGVSSTNVTVNGSVDSAQKGGDSKMMNLGLTTAYVKAVGGAGGKNALISDQSGGSGSTNGCIGDELYSGGNGAAGDASGGGGGGGAGDASNGTNAVDIYFGGGGFAGGGNGSNGRGASGAGNPALAASAPGGGGGGVTAATGVANRGGAGGAGKIIVTYNTLPLLLNLTTQTGNGGSIELNPPETSFQAGTVVGVTAVPDSGYQFMGWGGALSGLANPTSVLMDDHKTITATFAEFRVATFTNVGTFNWVVPAGVTSVTVECRGGGGAGGSARSAETSSNQARGGGGAGGSYARKVVSVTAGTTNKVMVGAGGIAALNVTNHNDVYAQQTGGDSLFTSFDFVTTNVLAVGGVGGGNALKTTAAHTPASGGVGSTVGCIGDFVFAGGNGGTPNTSGGGHSGGGGGGAGNASPGGNAPNGATTNGVGGLVGGGNGGIGRGAAGAPIVLPTAPGGGGGAVVRTSTLGTEVGAAGAKGSVTLTYTLAPEPLVNPGAPTLQVSVSGNTLSLAWPTNAGWTLLTNSVGLAATNQWFPYPNSANLTNVDIPIDPAQTNLFFKMQYPYP